MITLALKISIDETSPIFAEIEKAKLSIDSLSVDAKALFEQFFDGLLKVGNGLSELARFEVSDSPARAGHLLIRLYPSDSFLLFTAALAAGDINRLVIKHSH